MNTLPHGFSAEQHIFGEQGCPKQFSHSFLTLPKQNPSMLPKCISVSPQHTRKPVSIFFWDGLSCCTKHTRLQREQAQISNFPTKEKDRKNT
jgi:hypothetical protein